MGAATLSISLCVLGFGWLKICSQARKFDRCRDVMKLNALESRYVELKPMFLVRDKINLHAKFILFIVVVITMGSIPIYILRLTDTSHSHSTHWNTYSWTLSFAYMNGQVMGVMTIAVWMLAVVVFYIYTQFLGQVYSENSVVQHAADRYEKASSHKTTHAFYALSTLMIVSLSVLVNVLYILSTTEMALSSTVILLIRFCVSLFRLFTSTMVIPKLSTGIIDTTDKVIFMLHLLLFTNILIPCLATAVSSKNCFQVKFHRQNAQFQFQTLNKLYTILVVGTGVGTRGCKYSIYRE